jgi:hypothetical protein
VWVSKSDDFFVDLLYGMALSLGYSMDKTDVRSTSYFPEAYGAAEFSQAQIREGLKEVLEGKRAIAIEPRNPGHT